MTDKNLGEAWEVIGFESPRGGGGFISYGLKEELLKESIPNPTMRLIVEIGVKADDVRGRLVRVYYEHNNPMVGKYADTRLLCYMEKPLEDLNDLLNKYWIIT